MHLHILAGLSLLYLLGREACKGTATKDCQEEKQHCGLFVFRKVTNQILIPLQKMCNPPCCKEIKGSHLPNSVLKLCCYKWRDYVRNNACSLKLLTCDEGLCVGEPLPLKGGWLLVRYTYRALHYHERGTGLALKSRPLPIGMGLLCGRMHLWLMTLLSDCLKNYFFETVNS